MNTQIQYFLFQKINSSYEHNWKKGDLIMLDNKRFLHGRRKYKKNDPRDIVIIQSARASFGYGSTSRTTISKRQ